MKRCSCCKQMRSFSEYHRNKSRRDGLAGRCKSCRAMDCVVHSAEKKAYNAKYYAANRKRILAHKALWHAAHREENNARRAVYYAEHPKEEKARHKKYRAAHPERVKAYNKVYGATHRKEITAREKERRGIDTGFRLARYARTRLFRALKGKSKSGSAVKCLGCSVDEFRKYLESKWQPGMTWVNYGKGGWHLDHIYPVALFDQSDPAQFRECWHYTNYQPLWAADNLSKGIKPGKTVKQLSFWRR